MPVAFWCLVCASHNCGLCLQVRKEVESGIQFLLEGRERDPYKDLIPRLVYERSWGGKQAPTFPL